MSDFHKKLAENSREDLLQLLQIEYPELYKQVRRVEWVFENKLQHLHWNDGSPIQGRPFTNTELALLIDEPFSPSQKLSDMGYSIDQQRQIHIAKDPVLWAKYFLKANPRVYQILILRDPSLRKVLRAGRRLGKTWTMAVAILHWAYTNPEARIIVVAPMKAQAELIWRELVTLANKSDVVFKSIIRKVTSPQYMMELSNGSTVRFFTSGIRSGGKADVVRGQEAHLIILDELDYMHAADLDSIYAMLQKTAEDQPDKVLIGASTPTGRREKFWQWCTGNVFREFYFPSYANPNWSKEMEEEMRAQYTEMGYRHEIEADWGEDADGVYPRKFVDMAFLDPGWKYNLRSETSSDSFYVMGVDWDKYSAGVNIVVLEVCGPNHPEPRFRNGIKLAYREETPKEQYTLLNGTKRVIQLNEVLNPRHIYIDRGNGEVQYEMLQQYGLDHPASGFKKKLRGVQFAESIEVRDPATKELTKKEIKPFMVDNLIQMLEMQQIFFPVDDEDLYMQFISYVVARMTPTGRPVFEMMSGQPDHAHDALLLAALAITVNYGELMNQKYAVKAKVVSNETFLPLFSLSENGTQREKEEAIIEDVYGSTSQAPVAVQRSMSVRMRRSSGRPIRRGMF